MIDINLSLSEVLQLIGTKEVQIYQQCKQLDELNTQLKIKTFECSKLLQDRDMDQIELENLRRSNTKLTMITDRVEKLDRVIG